MAVPTVAIIVALSVWVRLRDLTAAGLWMDELWGASFVHLGLQDLLVAVARMDVHPPLAAERLQAIADDLRAHGTTHPVAEFRCICYWLAESDGIEDFNHLAHEYRIGIGFEHTPATGDEYIRALIKLSKDVFGEP
jgi:hypothetical protein